VNTWIRAGFVASALLALIVCLPLNALAYRPFDSTDADVAATGKVELELGPLGEPGVGLSGALIVSHRWPAATVHLNGQIELSRAHNLELFGGLIVEGPYTWTIRPVAEVFIDREFGRASETSGLIGAIWRAAENLSFDAAIRGARLDAGNAVEVRAGFTLDI
jgi:hypothetical protein